MILYGEQQLQHTRHVKLTIFINLFEVFHLSLTKIEGGWNEDGKGLNIWDVFSHVPGNIVGDASGDVACNSYHNFRQDVQLIKNMGLGQYRFSIAWARILPLGLGAINEAGVQYYNDLINELIANGITPVVTLYHWDLPQALEDAGGWLNPDVADWFADYSRVCFERFGDRVKFWITLNEPQVTSTRGYGTGKFAPGVVGEGTTAYVAAHNQIRAHAKSYRLYKNDFASQKGKQFRQ